MPESNANNRPHDTLCPECGSPTGAGDNYCRSCGAQLSSPESHPGRVGKSNLPFSFQLLILGGGLVAVTVLFFLYKEMKHESAPQKSENPPAAVDQAGMGQSPHDLTLPESFDELVDLGNKQMDAGSYAIAAECYRRALQQNPIAFDVRVDFAVCLHMVGMSPRAIEELQQVCKTAPDHSMAFYNAGIIFKELGQADSAKVYLQQYLSRFPDGDQRDNAQAALRDLSN